MKTHTRMLMMLLIPLLGLGMAGNAQKEYEKEQLEWKMQRQLEQKIYQDYLLLKPYFEEAYFRCPTIPRGVLEAVSYTYTRFQSTKCDTVENDPDVMPRVYSPMGLTLHGKGVFRENLRLVAKLSGVETNVLVQDPRMAILAYAKAFEQLQMQQGISGDSLELYAPVFIALAELPAPSFAMNTSLFAIYSFFTGEHSRFLDVQPRIIDFESLFGDQLHLLQSSRVSIVDTLPQEANATNADYDGAIWIAAASCNYTAGRSVNPSNVVIHYTSGTYAGAIAWFQNCRAKASAHYLIRSFDGQVTQMVRETDKAWHVGSENSYTIGIEHEAYGNVYSFFTPVMYQSSADLVKNICTRNTAINPLRMFYRDTLDNGTALNCGIHALGGSSACTQIRGHQHYPNQTHTDPGPYWNWNYYYRLVNADYTEELHTDWSGTFMDSGGLDGDYGNDERRLFHLHLAGADSVVLEFFAFDLEPDYDFLWIYSGATPFSPLLGRWNTQNPGRVSVAGEDLLVEFRSDCRTTAAGWEAQWHGVQNVVAVDSVNPTTAILWDEHIWLTHDTIISFIDEDNGRVGERFCQLMEYDGESWKAPAERGMLFENFNTALDTSVWSYDANWIVQDQTCRNINSSGTCYLNVKGAFNQTASTLYDFQLSFVEGDKCSFFFNVDREVCEQDDYNAYQIIFNRRDSMILICRNESGSLSILKQFCTVDFTGGMNSQWRVVWNRNQATIALFQNQQKLGVVRDHTPLQVGSYLAFATDSSIVMLSEVRVYVSRTSHLLATVGSESDNLIRCQSQEGMACCKLCTMVFDEAGNCSPMVEKLLKVDYTPPTTPDWILDGLEESAARLQRFSNVCARWAPSVDDNSGLVYDCQLVVTHGQSVDTVAMVVEGRNYLCKAVTFSPGESYVQVRVRAKNGAGLSSEWVCSPGVIFEKPILYRVRHFNVSPNPTHDNVQILANESVDQEYVGKEDWKGLLYDFSGRLLRQQNLGWSSSMSLDGLQPGVYVLKIMVGNEVVQIQKIVKY